MNGALIAAFLAWTPFATAEAGLPESLDLEKVRGLPAQHDGRWPPLDTVARDIVEQVTGDVFYGGHDPVRLLLAWTFDPQTWQREPLVEIGPAELRRKLELPPGQTDYSYAELVSHGPLLAQLEHLAHAERGRKPDPLESKVSQIGEQLATLRSVFEGRVIRLIPDPAEFTGAWRPVPSSPHGAPAGLEPVISAWLALKQAFLDDDAPAFDAAAQRLSLSLAALPAAHRPEPERIATELRYNRLRPFRSAWQVMVCGAALAAVAMVVRRRGSDVLALAGLLAGFGLLTYGLSLRWQIAGRIPAANMFESLLFLSWGMGAFAILSMLVMRNRAIPLMASALGALALLLADVLPLDHFVRPPAPVLMDTIWMSIHVPVIMVSYSVLAFAMLVAHAQLAVLAFAPRQHGWVRAIDAMHYWCVHVGAVLLLAGIITGSMWAASSWGRYWGWDPKEVWSLIAFLGYLAILHVRADREPIAWWGYLIGGSLVVALLAILASEFDPLTGKTLLAFAATAGAVVVFLTARGRMADALKSVLCFWLIVMTYVGVNFVLGRGLHSYGFGTGAVADYMLLLGGVDLGVVMVLCALALARRHELEPGPARNPAAQLA